jgi:hypothetical protein
MHDIGKFKRKLPTEKGQREVEEIPERMGASPQNVSFPKGFNPKGNQARKLRGRVPIMKWCQI